jgi:hypothetical protein
MALEALQSGDSWDFRFEKEPRCPHCGHVCSVSDNEWWFLYEEGEHEVECPSALCERTFTVSVHVSYSYSTDEQEEDEPDESPSRTQEES